MAVMVTMQVGPVDVAKFKAADEWAATQPQPGLVSNKIYRGESDPKTLLIVQEWDSHDSFHDVSEKLGEEFQKRAGTEGLDWITGVWVTA